MSAATENDIRRFFADLNLDSVGPNLFIGHVERVPFRLETVVNEQTIGLLFQTPFSASKKEVPEFPVVREGTLLHQLIAEKKAELSTGNDIVWFNLFAAHELIDDGVLMQTLNEFAAVLKEYFDFDNQVCFACKAATAKQPVFHSEKLHMICDGCFERLNQKAVALTSIDPANVIVATLWAFVAALAGGAIWAIGWLLFDKIFAGRKFFILLIMLAFIAMAIAVAWPISLVFKKIPRRGIRLAKFMTIATCVLTAIVGEILFSAFVTTRYVGTWNPRILWAVWKLVMIESGNLYLLGKIICLFSLCAFALDWSKPKTNLEEEIWGQVRQ